MNPEHIFEFMTGYMKTHAIKAAIDLDLFTQVDGGAKSATEIASATQSSERGVRILCDYLTVHGLPEKTEGRYRCMPESSFFLSKQSKAYLGGSIHFLGSSLLRHNFEDLTASVQRGGNPNAQTNALAPEHPMWIEFANGMRNMMMPPATAIAELVGGDGREMTVLDVAAGHGIFGVMVAARNPEARVTALDWANVLTVARGNAAAFGVADRWQALAGDAMSVDLGGSYDAILVTNFIHHLDRPACVAFYRRMASALKPNGAIYTLEFVPNDDRITPRTAATFPLVMLGTTPGGDAYTFAEIESITKDVGLLSNRMIDIEQSPQRLVISSRS